MLFWLTSIAFALPEYVTCVSGERLDDAVARAEANSRGTTIFIDAGCVTDGVERLDFDVGYGGVDEYGLAPSGSDPVDIPPIHVYPEVTVRLDNVRFTRTAPVILRPIMAELLQSDLGVAAMVDKGTLVVGDVSLDALDGAGIFLVDGTLEGTALSATGFTDARPLYVIADTLPATVSLSSASFEGNRWGGVALYGAGDVVSASFEWPTFADNGPAPAADIGAADNVELSLSDATFSGSVGYTEGTVPGAPIYISSSSMSCERCEFLGTSGDIASTIAAYLGTGDSVTLTDGQYAPANRSDPVMHIDSGGRFSVDGVRFVDAGELDRYAGVTTFSNVIFDGKGATPERYAVKLYGSATTFDKVTACDYGNSGWGLFGAYGSAVTIDASVFQSLALGGAAVVRVFDTFGAVDLDIHDNTMAGSDAVIVSGAPSSLVYTNNLVSTSTGGLNLTSTPAGADIGWNLWFDVDTPIAGSTPGATDVLDLDPRFVPEFDASLCGSIPRLQDGSPANAAGDPSRDDTYGNTPSDIGAVDLDDLPGDDTGDSGAADDTGAPDTDVPDTDAPDTDPAPPRRLVGGAIPPCGCGGGASATLLLPLALLVRRRR